MADPSGRSEAGGRFGPYIVLTGVLIILLVVMNVAILATNNKVIQHYYLATGDSISFGYQPNLDFFHGFADDLATQFRQGELNAPSAKVKVNINLANYACPGETTETMINGNCPFRNFLKETYACPQICSQLDAVVLFLQEHKGNVSPVTFELGSNDVLPDFDVANCSVSSNGAADLAAMDNNLIKVDHAHPDDATDTGNGILQRLVDALTIAPVPAHGPVRLAGDLVLLNYYNPFAKVCPNSVDFIHTLNDHLAADAATLHIPVVDVYAAFGGDSGMADNVCTYTWYCTNQDFHPTTKGYEVITTAVEATLGYPHALPIPASQPGSAAPPPAAYRGAP